MNMPIDAKVSCYIYFDFRIWLSFTAKTTFISVLSTYKFSTNDLNYAENPLSIYMKLLEKGVAIQH